MLRTALLLAASLALTPAPTNAATPLTGATAVSAGDLHSCAAVNGGVKCWGPNWSGQLGDGTQEDRAIATDVFGLPAGSNVTAVSAGRDHTCALVDGGVLCWGRNAEGQVGTGIQWPEVITPYPVVGLGPGSGVTSLSAGQFFTCAVVDGGVLCWGGNSRNVWTPSFAPQVVIPAGSGATMVSAGYDHACAVVSGGVQCWGYGALGRLGDGSVTDSVTPRTAIAPGSGVTMVAAGDDHSCALAAGQLKCWGANGSGQLGNPGAGLMSTVPVDVTGFSGTVVDVEAGLGHTCAVADGGVQCWGFNMLGGLGNGAANQGIESPVPVGVVGLGPGSGAVAASAGIYASCAVVSGGVQCWGYGEFGALGDGLLKTSPVPVAVVVDDPATNTAPSLGPVQITPTAIVAVGSAITASAVFVDPDAGDSHTCHVAWGDGTIHQSASWSSTCGGGHVYGRSGVYTVTIGVTDAAGASGSSTYAYVVVYDPSAGFVTGGGWFESAPGAYRADTTLAGRAHVGFVAKHQKGRSVPEGHTELQFKAAGLVFKSSSYGWLVIAGGKAMYRGTGAINGAGDYAFQMTAIDGRLHGGSDRIRVRIWDRASGTPIYDNQTCGPVDEHADACTVLEGGEIVIHSPKK